MSATEIGYKGLLEIEDPLEVWTPDGCYRGPEFLNKNKMPAGQTLPEAILEASRMDPVQRILTSGEWQQTDRRLQKTEPKAEKDMISGLYERTSTILDYRHGRFRYRRKEPYYFEGLLIQIPETDDEGNILTENGILEFDRIGRVKPNKGAIKAGHAWEMPLPAKSWYVRRMPKEIREVLKTFLDTAYGMKDAGERLPDSAFVSINPHGLITLVRGNWLGSPPEEGRFYIGSLGMMIPSRVVSARACAEQD